MAGDERKHGHEQGAVDHPEGIHLNHRQAAAVVPVRHDIPKRGGQRSTQREGDAQRGVPPAGAAAYFRQEHQHDSADPQCGAEHGEWFQGGAEEEPGPGDVQNDQEREDHGHEPRGNRGLGEIDEQVIDAEEEEPLQRHPEMLAQ